MHSLPPFLIKSQPARLLTRANRFVSNLARQPTARS